MVSPMSTFDSPIYVIGRQHSGNTMLISVFARHPSVHTFRNEDRFFEHVDRFTAPPSRAELKWLTEFLATASVPPLSSGERQTIHIWLKELKEKWSNSPRPVTAPSLYRTVKDRLARRAGATRWAQKATSYVFHVEPLLERFPDAKLLFLLRNPLDIAASVRIRSSDAYWLRMCTGWRMGVRRARSLQRAHPENLRIVRYEDVVGTPRDTVAELFRFCDLEFDESVLAIRRINTAESPFEAVGKQVGITDDKVGYFKERLLPVEQRTVAELTGFSVLEKEYPDLVEYILAGSRSSLALKIRLTVQGLARFLDDLFRRSINDPGGTIRRFWRRVRV